MRTATYNLNLRVGAGIPPIVKVSQNDEGRSIGFRLFDGALAYFPGATAEVTITGTKPSGLGFTETCSVSGSVAVVETTLAMTQESGQINAELRITDGTLNVGTTNFVLSVEPAPHPAGTTDGTTEEARTVLERCEQYAQEAQDAAGEVPSQVHDLVEEEIADALALKADKSTTYTKSEVDGLIESVDVETDTTLTLPGVPADAKATGDAISVINESLGALEDRIISGEVVYQGGYSQGYWNGVSSIWNYANTCCNTVPIEMSETDTVEITPNGQAVYLQDGESGSLAGFNALYDDVSLAANVYRTATKVVIPAGTVRKIYIRVANTTAHDTAIVPADVDIEIKTVIAKEETGLTEAEQAEIIGLLS